MNPCQWYLPAPNLMSVKGTLGWIILFSLKGFSNFTALFKFKCFFKLYLGFGSACCVKRALAIDGLGLCSQVAFLHLMYLLLLLLLLSVVPQTHNDDKTRGLSVLPYLRLIVIQIMAVHLYGLFSYISKTLLDSDSRFFPIYSLSLCFFLSPFLPVSLVVNNGCRVNFA